jgi:hypothetical protein
MNLLAGLETFLYLISSVLLFPVIAGLALLVGWIVISFGAFLREWLERRRNVFAPLERYRTRLAGALETPDREHLDLEMERLLQTAELAQITSLDRVRFVIRVGPALGLMGTLIPMGISLSSLAQGDLPKMAGSMVTAFTTVVVGLACSIAAYLMSLAKEKWVRADLREMEYLTEATLRDRLGKSAALADEERGHALS